MAIPSLKDAAGMTAQPPGGARFYRCALQVNPHHYAQTYRGQATQGDALCFITEGIVPRMRGEKQRRQFIFSTHNANIPVLGDAELIVGLSAAGEADRGQARVAPEHTGSIDSPSVRELVEEILEGGREAFERRRKYGF